MSDCDPKIVNAGKAVKAAIEAITKHEHNGDAMAFAEEYCCHVQQTRGRGDVYAYGEADCFDKLRRFLCFYYNADYRTLPAIEDALADYQSLLKDGEKKQAEEKAVFAKKNTYNYHKD
jgi:hypothetical protein